VGDAVTPQDSRSPAPVCAQKERDGEAVTLLEGQPMIAWGLLLGLIVGIFVGQMLPGMIVGMLVGMLFDVFHAQQGAGTPVPAQKRKATKKR
jgi:F0F1-type ATP synthase assembly protein I